MTWTPSGAGGCSVSIIRDRQRCYPSLNCHGDHVDRANILAATELLAEGKELGDASQSDLIRSCGYVSAKKDGAERLNSPPSTSPYWRPRASGWEPMESAKIPAASAS